MINVRRRLFYIIIVLAVAGSIAPLVLSQYQLTVLNEVIIFSIYAIGINVLLGQTGYVSIGHSMFLGFGGYGIAVLTEIVGLPFWQALILTLIGTCFIAFAIGVVCMRVSRIQFLVITLAMSQMFYGIFVKLRVTGGDDGMAGISRPDMSWAGIDIWNGNYFYYYVLGVFAVVLFASHRIAHSPFGSVLKGIRENELRMQALGYSVAIYKNLAFTLSGLISGIAGILLAQHLDFVNPDTMSWEMSGEGLLMVIMGGWKVFVGPVIGAGFFVIIKEQLSTFTDEYIIFFGLFFILVVTLFRGGIGGLMVRLFERGSKNELA